MGEKGELTFCHGARTIFFESHVLTTFAPFLHITHGEGEGEEKSQEQLCQFSKVSLI